MSAVKNCELKFIQVNNDDDHIGMYHISDNKITLFEKDIGILGIQHFDGFGDYVYPVFYPFKKSFIGFFKNKDFLDLFHDGVVYEMSDKKKSVTVVSLVIFQLLIIKSEKTKICLFWNRDFISSWPYNSNVLSNVSKIFNDEKWYREYLKIITEQKIDHK